MTDISGGYYSSLDADSKLPDGSYAEGEYYLWGENELKELIGNDFDLFSKYYNVNEYGFWEAENKYVLIRSIGDIKFINNNNLDKQ